MQFITCRVGEQLFGVDITMVREVNQVLEITPVPGEKPHIKGLINLRGQIVTILDTRARLGFEPSDDPKGGSHNIILKGGAELRDLFRDNMDAVRDINDPSGLLVDAIGDVIDAGDGEVEPPPANVGAVDAALLQGVVKKEEALIAILNIPRVLTFN